MEEVIMIEKIVEVFKDKTKEYSKSLEADGYDTQTYYVRNNKEKGYSFIDASLEFKEFVLKMEYKVNVGIMLPKSTLEMRILFKAGKFPVEYSIYDLLNYIDKTNFNCYTIPYILDTETMEKALDYLFNAFILYKERISELLYNIEEFNELEKNIKEQIVEILGGNIFKSIDANYTSRMLEVYYVLDAGRFANGIYANYVLTGKYTKAIKEYSKSNQVVTLYEKRLKDYLKEVKGTIKFLPDGLETVKLAKKYQKVGVKQSLLMLLFLLVASSVWTMIYGAIYTITHTYFAKDSLYTSNSEIILVIILGFVTSVINVVFARMLIAKWTFKEKYEEYKRLDLLSGGRKINNLVTKLFQFVIAACTVLSMLAANTYISFTKENIVLKKDYLNLKGETVSYDNVEGIYVVYKMDDDMVEGSKNNNYVIVLKDKTKINLDWYLTNSEIEEKVLPILKEKQIKLEIVEDIIKD